MSDKAVTDSVSDTELIAAAAAGNEQAFETLYHRYRLQLYSYLNKLLPGQSAIVDDLYQQTWLRVLDHLGAYEDRRKFISWLYRIAHNLAMDHFRRSARTETIEVDECFAADTAAPWEPMDRKELQAALGAAVEQLAPEQREVVLLRQQDLSFKEIAAIQATGVNTVLGRMHYAVRRLQQLLANWNQSPRSCTISGQREKERQ